MSRLLSRYRNMELNQLNECLEIIALVLYYWWWPNNATLNSCAKILLFIVWIGLSIAMIVMGVIYQDKCPAQPYIPIFLIVMAATQLASVALLGRRDLELGSGTFSNIPVLETCTLALECLLGLFNYAWLIAEWNKKWTT
ncbi:uncharacterized protein [Hyperolius riggenbachi]|uniref:uncharacterized protein isoform X2 n=1 Tax=Hyperolius riggenbachi TaxID=752182 RepID=UPI0035A2B815